MLTKCFEIKYRLRLHFAPAIDWTTVFSRIIQCCELTNLIARSKFIWSKSAFNRPPTKLRTLRFWFVSWVQIFCKFIIPYAESWIRSSRSWNRDTKSPWCKSALNLIQFNGSYSIHKLVLSRLSKIKHGGKDVSVTAKSCWRKQSFVYADQCLGERLYAIVTADIWEQWVTIRVFK